MSNPRWNPVHRVQQVTTPAAGSEWTFSPQNAAACWIYSVRFLFATSAVVGSRFASLLATDGSNRYWQTNPAATQAASLTRGYHAVTGFSVGAAGGTSIPIDFPSYGLYLPPGYVLRSFTENLDAGDAFTSIFMGMWEFPTGAPFAMFPVPHFFTQSSE